MNFLYPLLYMKNLNSCKFWQIVSSLCSTLPNLYSFLFFPGVTFISFIFPLKEKSFSKKIHFRPLNGASLEGVTAAPCVCSVLLLHSLTCSTSEMYPAAQKGFTYSFLVDNLV